ncbi:MAG: phosphoribosylglycinamide formyltransferase [Candidatus Omnitrophica bacterium]|nr:phosphoribosylglycinamide formyltransferase [Candidatus Omnitrophota bacterium]
MMNIAVLASGNGSNFQALASAVKRGYIRACVKLLVVDKEGAYARVRARRLKIKDIFIDPKRFRTRVDFDEALRKLLKAEKIDLVVLAGFMRILSPRFVRAFKNRIVNIHPALLPAFRGEHAIKRALTYGCTMTGVTVHFVDESVDHGPVILQGAVTIKAGTKLSDLEKKIHRLEHLLYPKAVKLFVEKKLHVKNRRVTIR